LNDEAREFRWVSLNEAIGMAINQPTRTLLRAVSDNPVKKVKRVKSVKSVKSVPMA